MYDNNPNVIYQMIEFRQKYLCYCYQEGTCAIGGRCYDAKALNREESRNACWQSKYFININYYLTQHLLMLDIYFGKH